MIFRHNKRSVPELNTTSTADISFILLVFFLVITSMDVDKGLSRQLPPIDNTDKQEQHDISKSNVMDLKITSSNVILKDGKPANINSLRNDVMLFVSKTADRQHHVITLDIDRNATYDTYFNVQNEIVAAYNTLRNQYAIKTFGHNYESCTPDQRKKVRAYYPQRITEVYSDNTEGGAQ
ncbi:MAG: biopolymer transporter ExbD [Prevotellaceae bacterium]|nr:biopolymer transporter ExbD [Prevotellaceae bacterium]